jgi:hypothetical protein
VGEKRAVENTEKDEHREKENTEGHRARNGFYETSKNINKTTR